MKYSFIILLTILSFSVNSAICSLTWEYSCKFTDEIPIDNCGQVKFKLLINDKDTRYIRYWKYKALYWSSTTCPACADVGMKAIYNNVPSIKAVANCNNG